MKRIIILVSLTILTASIKAQHTINLSIGAIEAKEKSVLDQGGQVSLGYEYEFKNGITCNAAVKYALLDQSVEYSIWYDPTIVKVHNNEDFTRWREISEMGGLNSLDLLQHSWAIKTSVGYRFFRSKYLQPHFEIGITYNNTIQKLQDFELIGDEYQYHSIWYSKKENFHLGFFISPSVLLKLSKHHGLTAGYNYNYYPNAPAGHSIVKLEVTGYEFGYQFSF